MSEKENKRAFPRLDDEEMQLLAKVATCQEFSDGKIVARVGTADVDFFVVHDGQVDVVNPAADNALIVSHGPGEFFGDIDMLTRRPIIVTAIARGKSTRLMRVSGKKLRELLNTVPRLSEKLLVAFQVRRELLKQAGVLGMKVIGPGDCRDSTVVREFLHKNFVPFTWYDTKTTEGARQLAAVGSPKKSPVIECGDGQVLINPSLRDLARSAGIWRECPDDQFDLAIVGAGPAGIAAAVYAASEGLRTIVVDSLGPGGQVGGSSRIENFIGFPAGLSGNDLATRGVLQMLKFGARLAAPINVDRLDPGEGDECHRLHLDCGNKIRAQTVLVATGVAWRKLPAKNADRFERAGIYYACTIVETTTHHGTDVVVVGAGNSAGQAAMFLAENCARSVHMLIRGPQLGPGMSDYLATRIRATQNIVVHTDVEIEEVLGTQRVEGVEARYKSDDRRERLECTAIFVFIGAEPGATWLPDGIARDKLGYILTGVDAVKSGRWPIKDREPCPLETTLPRVMAAGDVRSGSTKRVGFAVGDGSLAVTCAHRLRLGVKS